MQGFFMPTFREKIIKMPLEDRASNLATPRVNLHRLRFSSGLFFAYFFVLCTIFATPAKAETASYYTHESCRREGTSGILTASGERFDENALTCAMRRRDFGKSYRITNLNNGKSVIVIQNDFGPNKKLHAKGRTVDLSKAAFAKIADLKQGVVRVKVEAVS